MFIPEAHRFGETGSNFWTKLKRFDLPEPQDLASGAITELDAVVVDLKEIIALPDKEEGI